MFKKFALFSITAYLLNFGWEFLHAQFLYATYHGAAIPQSPSAEYLQLITYASFMDLLMLLGILLVGALLWRNWDWFRDMQNKKYAYYLLAALALAVFVEIKGVYLFHDWTYSALMPQIFGLGVSPLLQLPITGLLALLVLRAQAVQDGVTPSSAGTN